MTIISSSRTSTCSEGMRYRLSNAAPTQPPIGARVPDGARCQLAHHSQPLIWRREPLLRATKSTQACAPIYGPLPAGRLSAARDQRPPSSEATVRRIRALIESQDQSLRAPAFATSFLNSTTRDSMFAFVMEVTPSLVSPQRVVSLKVSRPSRPPTARRIL